MGESSPILEFFSARDVLVTGATGFLGKVLVEKLLYSVPTLRSVYLLMRPYKGQDAASRLESMKAGRVFQRIRDKCPEALSKLRAVAGDLSAPELGLSPSDRSRLTDSVSVVFHCAATVKFDEALRLSVSMNVVGTQRLVALCHQMRHLVALVHASTAYANCDRSQIGETVYPPPFNPAKVMDAFEWMSDDMVEALTPALVGARPNTYTLTKALAEFLLVEQSGELPCIIIRPSIIGAAWKEPFPGWVDNLNGPTGLFIAVGKGLLHNMGGDVSAKADIVPVDLVANLLIVGAWSRALESAGSSVPVVNCCSGSLNPLRWGQILDSLAHYHHHPVEGVYRVPSWSMTRNRTYRNVMLWVNHMIPAYVADVVCQLLGKHARLVRLYDKLFKAVGSLEFFTSREWEFQSKDGEERRALEGVPRLWEALASSDREVFDFDIRRLSWPAYLDTYHTGCKLFMLSQTPDAAPQARTHFRRVQLWTRLLRLSWLLVLLRVGLGGRKGKGLRPLFHALVAFVARVLNALSAPLLGQLTASPS